MAIRYFFLVVLVATFCGNFGSEAFLLKRLLEHGRCDKCKSDGPTVTIQTVPKRTELVIDSAPQIQLLNQPSNVQLVSSSSLSPSQINQIQVSESEPLLTSSSNQVILSQSDPIISSSSVGQIVTQNDPLISSQLISPSNQYILSQSNPILTTSSSLGQIVSPSNNQFVVESDPLDQLASSQTSQVVVSQSDPILSSQVVSPSNQVIVSQSDPILTSSTSLGQIVSPGSQILVSQGDPSSTISQIQVQPDIQVSNVQSIDVVQTVISSLITTRDQSCHNDAVSTCRGVGSSVKAIIRCGLQWLRRNKVRCAVRKLLDDILED